MPAALEVPSVVPEVPEVELSARVAIGALSAGVVALDFVDVDGVPEFEFADVSVTAPPPIELGPLAVAVVDPLRPLAVAAFPPPVDAAFPPPTDVSELLVTI